MTIKDGRFNLAAEWPEDKRHDLYLERVRLLIHALEETRDGEGLTVDSLRTEPLKLIAAFSLMQLGYIELNVENPEQIGLTDIGYSTARGYAVLNDLTS